MKFYFYYGTMNSSKTANALMKKFNFEECGKRVAMVKPGLDTRHGKGIIKSRIGLESEAYFLDENSKVENILDKRNYDIIIIDEAQFLTLKQVDELRELADNGVMVMCYGLKTDYTNHLFEGTKRILEVCDTIREIQSMCTKCETKGIVNGKYIGDTILYETQDGNIIDIGGEEKYITLCHKCWVKGKI